jgi:hypothetical protein
MSCAQLAPLVIPHARAAVLSTCTSWRARNPGLSGMKMAPIRLAAKASSAAIRPVGQVHGDSSPRDAQPRQTAASRKVAAPVSA